MYSYKNKNLHCENINLIELSKKVGSPFYCYSSKILESKYSELTDAFKEEDLLVCFSLKANSNQLTSNSNQLESNSTHLKYV